jgi:hypothetical protein
MAPDIWASGTENDEYDCASRAREGVPQRRGWSRGLHRDRQEANLPGPQQERQQEKRDQKLKDISEQVAQGKLVIRTMTDEERARFPKREASAARRGAKRRS